MVDTSSWFGDLDLGEFFFKYFLDPDLRCYAGVDMTDLCSGKYGTKRVWERWERIIFGFRYSAYVCVRGYLWSEEIIKRDRLQLDVFR